MITRSLKIGFWVRTATCAAVLTVAGCASHQPLPELLSARQEVQAAAADPDAAKAGALRLADARKALQDAEDATARGKPKGVIVDYAYTASRNAQIAQQQGSEARSRAEVAQGEANRNAVLLEARTREAEAAKAAAAANAQQATANALQAKAAMDEAARLQGELQALNAKQTSRGMVLTLGDVLFATNRADVKPGSMEQLRRVAAFMQENAGVRLRVEGNTDNTGSPAYNDALSSRRANAVADVLANSGVERSRIEAIGRGQGNPVASNDNAAGRQQNRRVELIFSDQHGTFTGQGNAAGG